METEQTIGSLLREKRESKKLSIEEVATKTKINLNILKHLEANELDKLPNKTYVRGFVKNYAKIVGISQSDVLDSLDATYNEQEPATEKVDIILEEAEAQAQSEKFEAQEKLISIVHSLINKKVIITVVALVVLIFITKGVVSFFSQISSEQVNYNAKSDEKAEEVSDKVTSEEVVADSEDAEIKTSDKNILEMEANKKLKEEKLKELQAKEDAEKKKKEEEEKKALEAKKKAEEEAEAKRIAKEKKESEVQKNLGGKYPYVSFYPAPKNLYEVLEDAPENTNEELLPSRFRSAIEEGIQNVYITATDGDTWISYQSDEEDIKRFVLKQGRSVLIKGKTILLFMGNINVAKIFLNNKLIKAYSKTGVKSIIFPESEAVEYQLPLFPSYKGVPMKASEYKANMADKE